MFLIYLFGFSQAYCSVLFYYLRLLLLYISYKLYRDVIKNQDTNKKIIKSKKSSFTFRKAVLTIVIADISMSLDNVLGVAGAAKQHYFLLVFGLGGVSI